MKIIQISAKAQHGKDSTADILKAKLEAQGKKVLITHYADLIKYIAKTFFNWDGEKDSVGRSLLQRIGTEDFRKVYPTFWIDFVKSILIIYPDQWDYVLIPDCRYPNEVEAFNTMDNIVVRVTRVDFENSLTPEQRLHSSEIALDHYSFDYYINSRSGIPNLEIEVDKFIKEKLTNVV